MSLIILRYNMYLDTCGAAISVHQLGMLCMSFPVLQYPTQTCKNAVFLHMIKYFLFMTLAFLFMLIF